MLGAVLDQALERLHGALKPGLLGEQALEGVDRGVRVVELLILQLGDAQQDPLARGRVLGPLEALAQRLDERVPAAQVLVHALEAVARDRLLGLGLEHADEGADRQLRVAEDAEREFAEAHEHVDLALLVEAGVGLAPVGLGQRLPLLGAGQGLLERREHGGVTRTGLDQALVQRHRLGRLIEALPQLGRLAHDRQGLVALVALGVAGDVGGEEVGQRLAAGQRVGQAGQLIAGRLVRRILLEDAAVGVEGRVVVLEHVLLDLGRTRQDLDPRGGVVASLGEAKLLDLDQARPVLGRGEHRLELLDHLRAQVLVGEVALEVRAPGHELGLVAQGLGEVAQALAEVAELLAVDVGQAQLGLGALAARLSLELALEEAGQVVPATGRLVERREHGLGGRPRGAVGPHALVQADRVLRAAELTAVDLGGAHEVGVARIAFAALAAADQQLGERVVIGLAHQHRLERVRGLGVASVVLEQALLGPPGLVEAPLPGRLAADRPQHAGLQRRVTDAVDDLEVGVEQLGVTTAIDGAEALEAIEDVGQLGLIAGLGQRLTQHRKGALEITQALLVGARDLQ